ncbi:hypothetical protein Ddye_014156 [Dipteronia dyeriana]|uniref:Nuclear pore complex protein NUP96 C-terminal domain-containing protein n=1 Tax=Dipteronia dyeriana TaxID=168575 RepID=A0AAD9X7I8_9ROSI|nr:hypothetical protein Ddye_014156 [Dipteronia dyeriana]
MVKELLIKLFTSMEKNFSHLTLPSQIELLKVQSAVEAFALEADDLKSLAAQFNLTPLHNNQVRHINGGSSEGENKSQDDGIVAMNGDGSLTSLGATTYTTKFTASGNGALQRTNTRRARIPDDVVPSEIPDDQKPVEPDLTELQGELQRLIEFSGKSLREITLGEIHMFTHTALEKLCATQRVFSKMIKEGKRYSRQYLLELYRHYRESTGCSWEAGISASARLLLMDQVRVIKVLFFSERENSGQSKSVAFDSEEDMMHDTKEGPPEVDLEALPLISKSRVQLLAARKCLLPCTRGSKLLATELAASKGDVRLACLLSQAGGSVMSCSDVARQLNLWKINVLDFNFIEKDRIRL